MALVDIRTNRLSSRQNDSSESPGSPGLSFLYDESEKNNLDKNQLAKSRGRDLYALAASFLPDTPRIS